MACSSSMRSLSGPAQATSSLEQSQDGLFTQHNHSSAYALLCPVTSFVPPCALALPCAVLCSLTLSCWLTSAAAVGETAS